jgi:hypothetical protein
MYYNYYLRQLYTSIQLQNFQQYLKDIQGDAFRPMVLQMNLLYSFKTINNNDEVKVAFKFEFQVVDKRFRQTSFLEVNIRFT